MPYKPVYYRIEEKLESCLDVTITALYKGFDSRTKKRGWHFTSPGLGAIYLGENVSEALTRIGEIAESWKDVPF